MKVISFSDYNWIFGKIAHKLMIIPLEKAQLDISQTLLLLRTFIVFAYSILFDWKSVQSLYFVIPYLCSLNRLLILWYLSTILFRSFLKWIAKSKTVTVVLTYIFYLPFKSASVILIRFKTLLRAEGKLMNLCFESSYHIISDSLAFSRKIIFSLVLSHNYDSNSYFVGRAATNSRNANSAAIHQQRQKLRLLLSFFPPFSTRNFS